MYLNFKQGLISGSNFILEGSTTWGIQITGVNLQMTLSNGKQDILVTIDDDMSGVFGKVDKNKDQFLFIEIDRRGNYVFGSMDNDYIVSNTEPQNIDDGQWWYNTKNNTLYKKIPNRGFMKTIGCILAEIESGVVKEKPVNSSQVEVFGSRNEFRASELLRDYKKNSIILSDGTYLTKSSNLLVDGVVPLGSIEAANLYGIADEDIPEFSVVRIVDNGDDLPKIELVEYDDVGESVVGFVKDVTYYGETTKVSLHGIFINSSWDLLDGAHTGDFVFAGLDNDRGLVVNKDPHSENNLIPRQPPIGRIINKNTILFTTSNNQIIEIEEEKPEPIGPATTEKAGIVKLSKPSANPVDPVVVEVNDPRMYDAREPLPHTHEMDEVDFNFDDIDIDFDQGGGTGGATPDPSNLEEWIEYLFINKVEFDDPRLSDPRLPLPHLHLGRDVEVEEFEDFSGNIQNSDDAQSWIERLFNEKIGRTGGIVDGTLSIMREPVYGTDAVNKSFVDKILGSAHRTVRLSERIENITSGATKEVVVDLGGYGIELEGSGVRGILYYKNSTASSNSYELSVNDPVRGRQYISVGSGEDRDPITVEFTEDIIISVRNTGSGNIDVVDVEISILILEGIESIQIGVDDLDEIVVTSSGTTITDGELRTLTKRIEVGYGETNAESIIFNTLGNQSTRVIEVDLSLMEREYELNDTSNYIKVDGGTKVLNGGFLDVGELQELYDIMCPACVAHKGNRCASNAHEAACTNANNVLTSSSTTQGDVDSALLSLRNSAFMAITSGSGPITIDTSGGSNNYAIKYRELASNGQLIELKPFNSSNYNKATTFSGPIEIYIAGQNVTNPPNITTTAIKNSSTLDRIVTWGELGIKRFVLSGNTRAFNVPNWLPSSVNTMASMFQACSNFNSTNVSMWDTTNITSLSHTFYAANKFNQNINSWSTNNVTTLEMTFHGGVFNQPLNNWNTSKVTVLHGTFTSSNFNQDINNWDTSKVTRMSSTFSGTPFNKPLNSWNVTSVTTMRFMFNNSSFNQPLSNWNPKNVTNMSYMFQNSLFNQPLKVASGSNNYMNPNRWDTRKVTNMNYMFSGSAFNQQTIDWRVEKVNITKDYPGFRRGASTDEFNAQAWARTRPRFGMGAPTNQYNTTNGTKDGFWVSRFKHVNGSGNSSYIHPLAFVGDESDGAVFYSYERQCGASSNYSIISNKAVNYQIYSNSVGFTFKDPFTFPIKVRYDSGLLEFIATSNKGYGIVSINWIKFQLGALSPIDGTSIWPPNLLKIYNSLGGEYQEFTSQTEYDNSFYADGDPWANSNFPLDANPPINLVYFGGLFNGGVLAGDWSS